MPLNNLNIKNEIKIGLTVLIAIIVAILGFRYMQDFPMFRQAMTVYSHFDRADGVSPGTPVNVSGVKIGSVREVELYGPDSVRVEMSITLPEGIPRESIAIIEATDIVGTRAIRIQQSHQQERVPHGGRIDGHFDEGIMGEMRDFSDEMRPDIQQSSQRLRSVLGQLDNMLDEGGGSENIIGILDNLNRTTRQVDNAFEYHNRELEQAIASFQHVMSNLDTLSSGRQAQVDSLLNNLEIASNDIRNISRDLGSASRELDMTLRKINEGDGTISRLVNDPSLYNNLDSLSVNMNRLIKEINEDPRKFLRHMRLIEVF